MQVAAEIAVGFEGVEDADRPGRNSGRGFDPGVLIEVARSEDPVDQAGDQALALAGDFGPRVELVIFGAQRGSESDHR